ncbi:peptide deformylase [Anatilimnocola sp. NA78]|uniref:peptide deformylase n=1 Tax=Anatilimnocola sp. NA78 TaxID=3415683 RepID=UPI003CE4998C
MFVQIIAYPHPTLRHVSKPIRRVDAELKQIIRDMFALMYEAKGIGLAANQVNLPLRLFVMNLESDPDKGRELVFINPVISVPKGSAEAEEGCLSLPGLYGPVVRPKTVRITAYGLDGKELDINATDLLARCVQHEVDHLDGVLFTDRMSAGAKADALEEILDFEMIFNSQRSTGNIPSDDVLAAERAEWEKKYC